MAKKNKQDIDPISISAEDAAKVTGLSRSTLYNLMNDGLLAWSKVKSRRLILLVDLHEFLEKAKIKREPQEPKEQKERK